MRKIFLVACLWGAVSTSLGDLLVNHPTSTAYVTAFSAGQGYSAGAVPWSLTSVRSPSSGFTGTPYYGGATGSIAVAVNGIHVVNHAANDYINLSSGAGVVTDWIVMVPTYPLVSASEITNIVFTPRLSGSANNQTNYTRIVIEQDGKHYLSDTNWYFNSNLQTLNQTAIDALTWYTYDPTNNLSGINSPAASGVGPTNVTAVGIMFYNQSKIVGSLSVGLASFQVWGDAVAAPASMTNRLMYWDATNDVANLQNGNGTWNISNSNWVQNGIGANLSWSNHTKDRAIFQGSDSGAWTVTIASASSITNIGVTFATTNAVYEIGGPGSLAMTDSPVITSITRGVISAAISGDAFTKRGNDVLVLAGTNTFSGTLNLLEGIIQVGSGTAGDLGHATVNNQSTLLYAHAGAHTFTNKITGTGDLLFTNTGVISWHGSSITQNNLKVMGGATLQQTGGVIDASGQINISGGASTTATLRIQGGTMFAPTTIVGRATVGELYVESGGSLQLSGVGTPLLVSDLAGGTGRVVVTGGGSVISAPAGSARIGNGYPAELIISDGGSVIADNMTVAGLLQIGEATGVLNGALTLANTEGENAIFNMDGASATFSVTNSDAVVAGFYVGNRGQATMNLTNGTLSTGAIDVPVNTGTGTLNMIDGSWTTLNSVQIGFVGVGRFNFKGGFLENNGATILGGSGTGTGTTIVENATWVQRTRFELGPSSEFRQTGGSVSNTSSQKRDYWGVTDISGGRHVLNGGGNVSIRGMFTMSNTAYFVNASTNSAANAHLLVGGSSAGATEGTMLLNGGTLVMTNASGLDDDILLAPFSFNTGIVRIAGATVHVHAVAMGGVPTNYNSFSLLMHKATSSFARLELSAGELYIKNGISNLTQSGTSELWLSGGTLGALGSWHSSSGVDIVLTNSPGPGDVTINTAGNLVSLNGVISGPGSLTKSSSGVLTLSGANTYDGDTTVSDGTLALTGSGSISNSSLITVESGATLSVTGRPDKTLHVGVGSSLAAGTIEGHVSLDGGALLPGTSPGIMTVSNLTVNSGTYRFEITNATGTAGIDWDVIDGSNGSGIVDLTGATAGSITVRLESADTSLPNFPPSGIINWTFVDAGTVNGFASNKFTIITSEFSPVQKYDVTFAISEVSGDLFITTATITNEADLSVSITATPSFLQYGDTNAVTVVVLNNSTVGSGSYYVTNTLSTGVVYEVGAAVTNPLTMAVTYYTTDGGIYSGGTFISGGTSFAGGGYSGGVVVWSLGNLGGGATTNLVLMAQQVFAGSSTQQVNNVVSTTVTTSLTDPNTGNNNASTSFNSVGIPLLSNLGMLIVAIAIFLVARHRMKKCVEA